MIKKSKQINKGKVKGQTDKADSKKKIVKAVVVEEVGAIDEYVWECISCSRKIIDKDKPVFCVCSQARYVINNQYTVKE